MSFMQSTTTYFLLHHRRESRPSINLHQTLKRNSWSLKTVPKDAELQESSQCLQTPSRNRERRLLPLRGSPGFTNFYGLSRSRLKIATSCSTFCCPLPYHNLSLTRWSCQASAAMSFTDLTRSPPTSSTTMPRSRNGEHLSNSPPGINTRTRGKEQTASLLWPNHIKHALG